jgi:hypothetical protein
VPTITITATVVDAGGNSASATTSCLVQTDREFKDNLVFDTYFPDTVKSGPYVDVPREPGSSVVEPGGVYENIIFNAAVTPPVSADQTPIVIRNAEFRGPAIPTSSPLLKCYNNGHTPVTVWHSLFRPQTPTYQSIAVAGDRYRLLGCQIDHVVDGFNIFNTTTKTGPADVEVAGTLVREHFWQGNPPLSGPADGTHSDCSQIQALSGTHIHGNNLQGFVAPEYTPTFYAPVNGRYQNNAVFMIKPDVGLISGLDIHHNLIDGGAFSINVAHDAPDRVLTNIGRISDNTFGRNQRQPTWTISLSSGVTCETLRNVYTDGTPIQVRRAAR